ncbi:17113_t:CDS:2 [Rhizophagus irregularis]|nr:17113_t:CDS:2 [Rhizophagus irregularis]
MGSDNQNQRSITSEIQTSTYNTNDTETEQFDEKTFNNDQDTISKKQDENQQQTNQFTFDRPVTVSDVLEGKITLPTPAPKKQIEILNGKKEIQRLSTTDSMQEFLEIPDNKHSGSCSFDENVV